jgi:hypothetical protein
MEGKLKFCAGILNRAIHIRNVLDTRGMIRSKYAAVATIEETRRWGSDSSSESSSCPVYL